MNYSQYLDTHPEIKVVALAAKELGIEAYIIGGYVRDCLLNRSVFKADLDFVCIGSGIELAELTAKKLGKVEGVTIYKTFGTALVKYKGKELEFVGARKESYNIDSRKPTVENGSREDDQKRRDFTINALALDISEKHYGELLDPFNGLSDLKNKIIRTPLEPGITFSDDPLRMMRAVRFAAQLNFDIEAETFEAIQQNIHRLPIVSKERFTDELNKIILSRHPGYGFQLLKSSGILEFLFPELLALQGAENTEGHTHKDNFSHTLEVLENVAKVSDDLWLRWAALLHDIAKPATKRFDPKVGFTFHGHEEKGARMVKGIFTRLKLPLNEKMKKVEKLVRLHLRPIALVKDTVTDSAIRRIMVDAGEDLEDLMILCRADITTKNKLKAKKYLANFDKVEQKMVEVEAKDNLRNFQPAMNGYQIMYLFNLKPSALVGELKLALRNAILDEVIPNDLNAAKDFIEKLGSAKGLFIRDDFKESEFLSATEEN